MTDIEQPQDVAFLDTNALHFLYLANRRASTDGVRLFTPGNRSGDFLKMLLTTRSLADDKPMRAALKKGASVIAFCRSKDLLIRYSPISELELQTGRAKGKALLKMAAQGVPERMWSQIRDSDISKQVRGQPLADCHRDVEDWLKRLTDELGSGPMAEPSESVVWDIARALSGLVYLTTCDCLVYANALHTHAKYVVTFDRHLKKTVNRIRSTDTKFYNDVRKAIQGYIGNVDFPEAPSVTSRSQYGL